jgi:hypothetical protein
LKGVHGKLPLRLACGLFSGVGRIQVTVVSLPVSGLRLARKRHAGRNARLLFGRVIKGALKAALSQLHEQVNTLDPGPIREIPSAKA